MKYFVTNPNPNPELFFSGYIKRMPPCPNTNFSLKKIWKT